MDDLQYLVSPWVILSTDNLLVLNLVINGWPSILLGALMVSAQLGLGFKPCYKWMTFNTQSANKNTLPQQKVLNLVINGWPSILKNYPEIDMFIFGEF